MFRDIKTQTQEEVSFNFSLNTGNLNYMGTYYAALMMYLEGYRHVKAFHYKKNDEVELESLAEQKNWVIDLYVVHAADRATYFMKIGEGQGVLISVGSRNISGYFYGATPKHNALSEEVFSGIWPPAKVSRDTSIVPVSFWSYDPSSGGLCRERDISSLVWKEIDQNYTAPVRSKLSEVMSVVPPIDGGKLILWHGQPGTGKSNAIRALANEWLPWCDVHYVVDPEAFFGNANYMLSVVLNEAGDESYWFDETYPDDNNLPGLEDNFFVLQGAKRWKLLIVEDADEFLQADAKDRTGQALSRLLNLGDGLVGQGLNYITLLTTNAKMAEIHPAVSRQGRCMSNIEFEAFSPSEAEEWVKNNGGEIPSEAKGSNLTLAALYDYRRNRQQIKSETKDFSTGVYL